MIERMDTLDLDPIENKDLFYLDQWLDTSFCPQELDQLRLDFEYKYRFMINYSVYDFLVYPLEIADKCPPHFHLHQKYSNYANDICIRLDTPKYFLHDSRHPIGCPEFMEVSYYSGNQAAVSSTFLSRTDREELDRFMRSSSIFFPTYNNWRMLVEDWNYFYSSKNNINVYELDEDSCPDYTQLASDYHA